MGRECDRAFAVFDWEGAIATFRVSERLYSDLIVPQGRLLQEV
jgi:hypothetical protein